MSFNEVRKLRYWCQKILPLVYDDSLSYYELLCKVVKYLNDVIENVNAIPEYIDNEIEERLSDDNIKQILSEFMRSIENAISSSNEVNNTNSSKDYPVGTMLWWNDVLYKTIRDIDAGDTLIVNTNLSEISFSELFEEFIDEVKDNFTYEDDKNSIISSKDRSVNSWVWIDDVLYIVTKPITEGNGYIYSGANQNVRQITMEEMINGEATARANADNALSTRIDNEVTARTNADNALGTRIDNEVTARTNADNALSTRIDNEVTARTNADNSLSDRINSEADTRNRDDSVLWGHMLTSFKEGVTGSILVISDSYVADFDTNFANILCSFLGKTMGTDFFVNALGGAGFSGHNSGKTFLQLLNETPISIVSNPTDISLVIFAGGTNDVGIGTLESDLITTVNRAKQLYANAGIAIFNTAGAVQEIQSKCEVDNIYCKGASECGASYNYIGCILKCNSDCMASDRIHPTTKGQKMLATAILTCLQGGNLHSNSIYARLINGSPFDFYAMADCNFVKVSCVPNNSVDDTLTLSSNVTFNGAQTAVSYSFSNPNYVTLLQCNNLDFIVGSGSCLIRVGAEDWKACTCNVKISNGVIEIKPLVAGTNGWESASANTSIGIASLFFNVTVPTLVA